MLVGGQIASELICCQDQKRYGQLRSEDTRRLAKWSDALDQHKRRTRQSRPDPPGRPTSSHCHHHRSGDPGTTSAIGGCARRA